MPPNWLRKNTSTHHFVGGLFTPKWQRTLCRPAQYDLAAIGRNFLRSRLAGKARRGEPIRSCCDCKTCQWFTDASRCPAIRKKSCRRMRIRLSKTIRLGRFFYNGKTNADKAPKEERKRIEYTDLKRGGKWGIGMNRKQILLAQMPAAGRGADCHRRCDHRRFVPAWVWAVLFGIGLVCYGISGLLRL